MKFSEAVPEPVSDAGRKHLKQLGVNSFNKMSTEPREEYLENDKEIPGQKYVCLSFLSPEKILANKEVFLFNAFVKDYEIQYKIKATEEFLMKEMRRVTDSLSKAEDTLKTGTDASGAVVYSDLSGAVEAFKTARANLSRDVAVSLENHVKENMRDFKETKIQDDFESFLFKNRKRLEDEFFNLNNFRTTVRGLKIRGCYDSYDEAAYRAKALQKLDPSFNVFVGQVGFWLPWDPAPSDIQNQEYAEDQLNTLMKSYKENEVKKDEFFEAQKRERLATAKVRSGAPTVGPADAPKAAELPTGMFDEPDLAIARKKTASNTIS
jgi:hypothetical protein